MLGWPSGTDREVQQAMAPRSPTVARLEFSLRVRERRRELNISAQEVSKHLDFSRVYYSSVENSKVVLSPHKLAPLLDLLQFDSTESAELANLLEASRERGWWSSYTDYIDPAFAEFLGLEHGASRIRVYEARVVTGMLQTREYATAVVDASPDISKANLSKFVDIRMERQQRLTGPDPVKLEVILSETALVQQYGEPGVLARQLESLLDTVWAAGSSVELRIQPFSMTPRGLGNSSTVVLLDFESSQLPTLAWDEGSAQLAINSEREAVAKLSLHYDEVASSSLNLDTSRQLVEQRLDQMAD